MRLKAVLLCLGLMLALSASSFAYYGTRPMGMGGAFTAIADDANAAYWNPAGFALNPGVDVTGSTRLTNRNQIMGDNMAAAKFCYEAEMNSPFDWIFGVGFLSAMAIDTAQYLGDQGILKKNWGRDVPKTSRQDSMASQVKAGGDSTDHSRNPIKTAVPKPGAQKKTSLFGPIQNLTFNFAPQRTTYWDNRWGYSDYSPRNKAQFAGGITWLNDTNFPLDEQRNWYMLSLASAWEERVAVGGSVNLYDLKVLSTGVKGFGAGIDLGAIAKPLPNVAVGLAVKEILTTDINWQNGVRTRYPMLVNGGIAIDPIEELTLAADVQNIFSQSAAAGEKQTLHYGAEFRPVRGLALRAGLFDGNKTAGASIGLGNLIADYAYLGGVFNKTQMLGVTWKF
ncbi:MAG: hypothetical protein WC490_03630 [Candidatus Margulisiibacteriota bacterium]